MQQIAQWLEQLGMSKYVQRFSDNRIDVSVLRDLSDELVTLPLSRMFSRGAWLGLRRR